MFVKAIKANEALFLNTRYQAYLTKNQKRMNIIPMTLTLTMQVQIQSDLVSVKPVMYSLNCGNYIGHSRSI